MKHSTYLALLASSLTMVCGAPCELTFITGNRFSATIDAANDGDRHHATHLAAEYLTSGGATITETLDDRELEAAFIYFTVPA